MVTAAQLPLRPRLKALPASLGFIALGLLPLWLALSSLVPSSRAMLRHAPLVAFSPRDAIGLPLGLLCFALAGMTLCPVPARQSGRVTEAQRKGYRAGVDWLKVWLGVAVAAILLAVVSVPVAEVAASWAMAGRGYAPCPAPANERYAPLRWIAGEGRCPV